MAIIKNKRFKGYNKPISYKVNDNGFDYIPVKKSYPESMYSKNIEACKELIFRSVSKDSIIYDILFNECESITGSLDLVAEAVYGAIAILAASFNTDKIENYCYSKDESDKLDKLFNLTDRILLEMDIDQRYRNAIDIQLIYNKECDDTISGNHSVLSPIHISAVVPLTQITISDFGEIKKIAEKGKYKYHVDISNYVNNVTVDIAENGESKKIFDDEEIDLVRKSIYEFMLSLGNTLYKFAINSSNDKCLGCSRLHTHDDICPINKFELSDNSDTQFNSKEVKDKFDVKFFEKEISFEYSVEIPSEYVDLLKKHGFKYESLVNNIVGLELTLKDIELSCDDNEIDDSTEGSVAYEVKQLHDELDENNDQEYEISGLESDPVKSMG